MCSYSRIRRRSAARAVRLRGALPGLDRLAEGPEQRLGFVVTALCNPGRAEDAVRLGEGPVLGLALLAVDRDRLLGQCLGLGSRVGRLLGRQQDDGPGDQTVSFRQAAPSCGQSLAGQGLGQFDLTAREQGSSAAAFQGVL